MKNLLPALLLIAGCLTAKSQWHKIAGPHAVSSIGLIAFNEDLSIGYILESYSSPKLYQSHDSGYSWRHTRNFYTTESNRFTAMKIMPGGKLLMVNKTQVCLLDTATLLLDTIYDLKANMLQPFFDGFRNPQMIFFDKDTGFILAHNLYRTTDGGLTWNTYGSVFVQIHHSFQFVDRKHGYFLGLTPRDKFTLYTTEDGGLTWDTTGPVVNGGSDSGAFTTTLKFVSTDTGFIGGRNSCIYRTVNRGQNWEIQYCLNDGKNYGDVQNVDFIDSRVGWMTVKGRDEQVFKTVDGGHNYFGQYLPPTSNGITYPNTLRIVTPELIFLESASWFYRTFNQGAVLCFQCQRRIIKKSITCLYIPTPQITTFLLKEHQAMQQFTI